MVGNSTSVTAAPAGRSAPSGPRINQVQSGTVASAGNSVAASGQKLPLVDVRQAVERLNELMSGAQRSLRFKVDEGSGRTVITVFNPHTHEVIRQIPSAELMAIAQSLARLGSLIDARI